MRVHVRVYTILNFCKYNNKYNILFKNKMIKHMLHTHKNICLYVFITFWKSNFHNITEFSNDKDYVTGIYL